MWVLRAREDAGFDFYDAFLVRAKTETDARKLAQDDASQFGYGSGGGNLSFWIDTETSSCEQLTSRGKACIVIGCFNAG